MRKSTIHYWLELLNDYGPTKYDPKLKITGSFEDDIKVSVTPEKKKNNKGGK